MFNEDFNEVADALSREISTNRRERTYHKAVLTELRELWKAIGQGCEPKKTTKKKTTKKAPAKKVEDEA